MIIPDYSPAASPSADQQFDALRRGLGRALQWAEARRLNRDCLLQACQTDHRFDQQVEDSRGNWLWSIIEAQNWVDDFRPQILAMLQTLADERSANQLCEFAFHYARLGDQAFRTCLYEIVQQRRTPQRPWIGEYELIALDGIEGFLTVAQVRGSELASREWEWDDSAVVEESMKQIGSELLQESLRQAAGEAIQRFRDAWIASQAKSEKPKAPSNKERMQSISVAEIIAAAESNSERLSLYRSWGMHAKESDLALVFERLLSAQDSRAISNYLRIFSNRPMPRYDPRVLELCQGSDDDVRCRAFAALEQLADPAVRDFALSESVKGIRDGSLVSLFIKNYAQGDEELIFSALELPDDECDAHSLLMDVVKLLERNLEADCSKLALVAYAKTPCTSCREYAVKLLVKQNCVPPWLASECQFDSEPEIRELVRTSTS